MCRDNKILPINVGYLSLTIVSKLYLGLFWWSLSTVSQFFFSDAFFNFLRNTQNTKKLRRVQLHRHIYLELPELPNDGLVQEEPDILLVVQGLHLAHVPLLSPFPVPWLSGENSFQDAETTEILRNHLCNTVLKLQTYCFSKTFQSSINQLE